MNHAPQKERPCAGLLALAEAELFGAQVQANDFDPERAALFLQVAELVAEIIATYRRTTQKERS